MHRFWYLIMFKCSIIPISVKIKPSSKSSILWICLFLIDDNLHQYCIDFIQIKFCDIHFINICWFSCKVLQIYPLNHVKARTLKIYVRFLWKSWTATHIEYYMEMRIVQKGLHIGNIMWQSSIDLILLDKLHTFDKLQWWRDI